MLLRTVVVLLLLNVAWSRAGLSKIRKLAKLHTPSTCETEGGVCGDINRNHCSEEGVAGEHWESGKCPGKDFMMCCLSPNVIVPRGADELSPCGEEVWNGVTDPRERLMVSATILFDLHHADGIYTQGGSRWQGIRDRMCPPTAPQKSDCSSAVSWIYWTVFGAGPDFMNGDEWGGGYTGTLVSRGTKVPCTVESLRQGDLVFYGKPGKRISHVNMYIGDGMCVDHGEAPVQHRAMNYRTMVECRTYLP
jgi:hypothetical protein